MAGDYDFGEDDYGDELPGPEASLASTTPVALFFDPSTRRHSLAADGRFDSIHQVDARVINALNIAIEKFPAVRDTGSGFWKLESPYDPRAQRKCEDWAKQALARLITANDIKLEYVKHEPVGSYGSAIEVGYVNLRVYPFVATSATVRR